MIVAKAYNRYQHLQITSILASSGLCIGNL